MRRARVRVAGEREGAGSSRARARSLGADARRGQSSALGTMLAGVRGPGREGAREEAPANEREGRARNRDGCVRGALVSPLVSARASRKKGRRRVEAAYLVAVVVVACAPDPRVNGV